MVGDEITKTSASPDFAVALHELPPSAHLMWPMYWEVCIYARPTQTRSGECTCARHVWRAPCVLSTLLPSAAVLPAARSPPPVLQCVWRVLEGCEGGEGTQQMPRQGSQGREDEW